MISIKPEHRHRHLPCHPTRAFLQQMGLVDAEAERQDEYQDSSSQSEEQSPNFKTILSRNLSAEGDEMSLGPKSKTDASKTNGIQTDLAWQEELYRADVIEQAYQESNASLPNSIKALIMQKQKLVEDKVYLGFMNSGHLLGRMYEENVGGNSEIKEHLKEDLSDMMKDIHDRISADLFITDKYYIRQSPSPTQIRNSKANDRTGLSEAYNSNSNNITESLQLDNLIVSHSAAQDFAPDSHQTKKAQEFIKKIVKQQEQHRRKKKQKEQRQKTLQIRSMQQKQYVEEELNSERKKSLQQRIEAKEELREKQLVRRHQMKKEYQQFLAKWKQRTPLFKQKEQEFERVRRSESEHKRHAYQQKRKQQLKPVRYSQLRQHEQKYTSVKLERQKQRMENKRMQLEVKPTKKYEKSKYHSLLVQEKLIQKQRRQSPKRLISELLQKKDQYSTSVRENHLPRTNPPPIQESLSPLDQLRRCRELKRGKHSDRQHVEQGDRNLKQVHQMVAKLREKGKLNQKADKSHVSVVNAKPSYVNYLNNFHPAANAKVQLQTVDQDFDDLQELERVTNRKYEVKASRRETYANVGQLSIDRILAEQSRAGDEYLQSAKAKAVLINKLG